MQILPFAIMGAGWLVFDWAVNKGLIHFTGKDVNQNLDAGFGKVLYLVHKETAPSNESDNVSES